jgi:hypothetical protein
MLVEGGEAKQQTFHLPASQSEAIKSWGLDPVVCGNGFGLPR